MVAVLLVFAVLWYFQDQNLIDARVAKSSLARRLRGVRADLAFSIANDDSSVLEEPLRELQSPELGPPVLPSQESAARFGEELLLHADERRLDVFAFGKTQTVAAVGEKEYQAIRFAIATQGTAESMLELLNFLKDFPTAAIQQLNFAKPSEGLDSWEYDSGTGFVLRRRGSIAAVKMESLRYLAR